MPRFWVWWGVTVLVLCGIGVVAAGILLPGVRTWFISQYFTVSVPRQDVPDLPAVSDDTSSTDEPAMGVVAENLEIPWEIEFLPDGSLLVTERPGRLVRILANERKVIPVEGVVHVGEGGLLGLALDPNYTTNHLLYLYHTTRVDGKLSNEVERYYFNEEDNTLSQKEVVVEAIPAAGNHDGGRIKFGPDGRLYVTTGDAQDEASARDQSKLSGKILRIDNGQPVVYSFGHRNPQGLSWDTQGNLWSTEHGRSGAASGFDEVNLIGFGQDYGWPQFQGEATGEGITAPKLQSGATKTWAPADVQVMGEYLLWTGLRGQAVYSANIHGNELEEFKEHFVGQFGRIRTARLSPDGRWLYIATSNRDGRGSVKNGDDRIIRISTEWFIQNNL